MSESKIPLISKNILSPEFSTTDKDVEMDMCHMSNSKFEADRTSHQNNDGDTSNQDTEKSVAVVISQNICPVTEASTGRSVDKDVCNNMSKPKSEEGSTPLQDSRRDDAATSTEIAFKYVDAQSFNSMSTTKPEVQTSFQYIFSSPLNVSSRMVEETVRRRRENSRRKAIFGTRPRKDIYQNRRTFTKMKKPITNSDRETFNYMSTSKPAVQYKFSNPLNLTTNMVHQTYLQVCGRTVDTRSNSLGILDTKHEKVASKDWMAVIKTKTNINRGPESFNNMSTSKPEVGKSPTSVQYKFSRPLSLSSNMVAQDHRRGVTSSACDQASGCYHPPSRLNHPCSNCPKLRVITLKQYKISPREAKNGVLVIAKIEGAQNINNTSEKLFKVITMSKQLLQFKLCSPTLRIFAHGNVVLAVLTANGPRVIKMGTVIGFCQMLNKDATARLCEPLSGDAVLQSGQEPSLKFGQEETKKFSLVAKGHPFRHYDVVHIQACSAVWGEVFSLRNRLAIVQSDTLIHLTLKNETRNDICDIRFIGPTARVENIIKASLDVLKVAADYDGYSLQSSNYCWGQRLIENFINIAEICVNKGRNVEAPYGARNTPSSVSNNQEVVVKESATHDKLVASENQLSVNKSGNGKRKKLAENPSTRKVKLQTEKSDRMWPAKFTRRLGPYLLSLRGIEVFVGVKNCENSFFKCSESCLCLTCWQKTKKHPN